MTKKTNTKTLIEAMRILARDIQSDDGVANGAISEAADRMEELQAQRDRLREALEFAEKRSKQIGETSNDYYERLAEEFRTTYGHLPPGKDDPLRTVDRDILQQEWEEFLSEPANARRAALQEDRDE